MDAHTSQIPFPEAIPPFFVLAADSWSTSQEDQNAVATHMQVILISLHRIMKKRCMEPRFSTQTVTYDHFGP